MAFRPSSDPPEVPENGLLLLHGPVLVVRDRRFLRKIDGRGPQSCKLLQAWGKTRRAILLIQLILCLRNGVPPLQSPKILVRIRTLLLNYLKLSFMYDAFLVPPLSDGNHTHIRTYRFKKCRSEWLGRRVRLG
jgi:hypothetical protein